MLTIPRALVASIVAWAALAGSAPAQSHPARAGHGYTHHHRHHWHLGFWGGFGWWPVVPAVVVVDPAPLEARRVTVDTAPLPPGPPDPVFVPRNGQDLFQAEADRQACNRWATTQPSALADAAVFHHSTLACMEQRGYSVRP